jgi:hypothetical protein
MAIELELEAEANVVGVVGATGDAAEPDTDTDWDDDTDDQAEFAQEVADTFAAAGILAEELPATTTEPDAVVSVAPLAADIDSSALDLLTQISNAELRCKRAEWVVIERKEALKEAKDEFDGCVAELRKIAAQAANDSKRPLFGYTPPAAPATPIATDVAPDAGTITSDAVLPEEAVIAVAADIPITWKSTSIDALGLTPSLTEKLREGDIATLGELSDLIARCDGASSDYWPKGIGKKKQQQIIESLLLWKENNGELGTADTTTIPVTLPDWEALSVEEQQVQLERRRELLINKTCDELDALYPADHPHLALYEEGKDCQANDDHLINCPYSPDANGNWEAADAWIAGWLWGDRRLDGSSEDAAG